MGTTTDILGLYMPANGEVSWGDEVSGNFATLDARITGDVANVMDYGAVGDGTTGDSDAIQAAIDTHAAVVYFPARPPDQFYALDSPLVPYVGQRYIGAARPRKDIERASSTMQCKSPNTTFWDCSTEAYVQFCQWENLHFDTNGLALTTVFQLGDPPGTNTLMVWCRFLNLGFFGVQAFSLGTDGWMITDFFDHCDFVSSYLDLKTSSGYVNNLHFSNCAWNGESGEIAVDIESPNNPQGNFFSQCYFESCTSSAIRIKSPYAFTLRDTYFEAINLSLEDYVSPEGTTRMKPAIDIIGANGVVVVSSITCSLGSAASIIGSTGGTGWGAHRSLTIEGVSGFDESPDASNETYKSDVSGFRFVDGTLQTFRSATNSAAYWYTGVPAFDCLLSSTWYISPASSDAFTIPNPLNASEGRVLTIILARQGGFGTITWGDKFQFAGGSTPGAPSSQDVYQFVFQGASAGLDGTYDPDNGTWVEISRSIGVA